jgi:2-keto-4-pentenoate hydratase/2-oxohepta-3-ene-1,7-dioic acid hydratase in catechol pathway
VGRIFCIGRNYAEHIKELGNKPDPGLAATGGPDDDACVVFMKPSSCIVRAGEDVVLPRGRGAVHHEAELVLRLDAAGAIDALALGLDLTLRDLQGTLKKKGSPWELAKAFDHAAPLGEWVPRQGQDLNALEFSCSVNGAVRQQGNTGDMLFSCARILKILARSWAPVAGDIIYTGTPAGVGPLVAGDRIAVESSMLGRWQWQCR